MALAYFVILDSPRSDTAEEIDEEEISKMRVVNL
jgi:hypothetical protein